MSETREGNVLDYAAAKTGEGKQPPRRSTLLRTPLVAGGWILTTLVAAALGAAATSFMDRARPDISISDIRLSTSLNQVLQATVPAAVANDKFFSEMENDPWLTTVDPNDPNSASKDLKHNIEKSKEVMQYMTEFRDAYPVLEELVEGENTAANAQSFFDRWEVLDVYIYAAIQGALHRGTMQATDLKNYPPSARHLLIDSSQSNGHTLYNVHKPGGMHKSVLDITDDTIPPDILKEIVYALAYFDQPVLRELLSIVKQDADDSSNIEHIQKEVLEFQNGFSRFSISVLLNNSGSKPVSFSPDAVLYVNTSGATDFNQNTAINLGIYDDKGNVEPMTLNGGETKLAILTSKTLVLNMPNWRTLLTLFSQSSRNCFIAINSAGGEWQSNSILQSSIRPFGVVATRDAMTADQVGARFARDH